MGQTAILFPNGVRQQDGAAAWLARAAQARRIAPMLAAKDAAILECYALECEAKAIRPAAQAAIAA
jgi:hypothetical protein